jgi:hypothetical protein
MLLGLVRPTAGSAHMLGMDITTDLPAILARTGSVIENPTFTRISRDAITCAWSRASPVPQRSGFRLFSI